MGDRWWESFDDPALDALVEEAFAGNFTVEAAWRRLQAARAVTRREGADLSPKLDAAGRVDSSLDRIGTAREGSSLLDYEWVDTRSKSAGLVAAYELDLWGRVRSLRDAARLDQEAAGQDVQAAAVTVAAEIASAWFELQEQVEQLRVLDEQVATSESTLDLVLIRFRRGEADTTNVWQQEQLIEARRGDREEVLARAQVLRGRLAVLTGKAPGLQPIPEPSGLATPPPLPATGTPAELVQRRPDVRSAFLAIAAADERVAAAAADRYPRVSLTASVDTAGPDWRDLFDNWASTIAANLAAPILDGGERSAELERERAVLGERVAEHSQRVLLALEEVEAALANESAQERRIESLSRQLQLARDSRRRLEERYLRGGAEFLDTLVSQGSVQGLERELLRARRARLAARVELCRALSGGWQMEEPVPLASSRQSTLGGAS